MAVQTVFKRYEMKYMITPEQKERLLAAMAPHMKPDKYGRTTIRNIYFDTDSYLLIRRSIEKPAYKEKLRIRSYEQAQPDSTVFVELKKKYDRVVYKRRICLSEAEAMAWTCNRLACPAPTQICREVDYFLDLYSPLRPAAFLSYEREAFCMEDSDFRVTFDDNVLCRQEDLSLQSQIYGTPLLPEGMILMELKCSGGIPMWMVQTLSRERIYQTSFSKYGTAYRTMIFPRLYGTAEQVSKEEVFHA